MDLEIESKQISASKSILGEKRIFSSTHLWEILEVGLFSYSVLFGCCL